MNLGLASLSFMAFLHRNHSSRSSTARSLLCDNNGTILLDALQTCEGYGSSFLDISPLSRLLHNRALSPFLSLWTRISLYPLEAATVSPLFPQYSHSAELWTWTDVTEVTAEASGWKNGDDVPKVLTMTSLSFLSQTAYYSSESDVCGRLRTEIRWLFFPQNSMPCQTENLTFSVEFYWMEPGLAVFLQ